MTTYILGITPTHAYPELTFLSEEQAADVVESDPDYFHFTIVEVGMPEEGPCPFNCGGKERRRRCTSCRWAGVETAPCRHGCGVFGSRNRCPDCR